MTICLIKDGKTILLARCESELMNKGIRSKKVYVLLILAVLLLLPNAAIAAQDNLLSNAGFETSKDGIPDTWSQDMWLTDEGVSKLWIDQTQAHSGASSAAVENLKPNHARWTQKVSVKPDTYYKISGFVKTEDIPAASSEQGAGANLFISDVSASYPQAYDTKGMWQELEFVGVTGPEQTEVMIGAGLGQYGALTTGKAFFDDIKLEQTVKPASSQGVISMDTAKKETTRAKQVSITSTVLMLGVFSIFFAYIYKVYMRKKTLKRPPLGPVFWFVLLLAVALAIRVWIAIHVSGYTGDINTFLYWSNRLKEVGFGHFYKEGIFADYPPGYMYVLYVVGVVKSLLSVADGGTAARLLIKLPAILADLGAGIMLYVLGRKKFGAHIALGLAAIYLLNPAIWINSASWGQIDAFFALFLVAFLYRLSQNKPERAAVWFALAVLIKPQALIFTPVLLLFFIYRKSWKRFLTSLGAGIVTLLVPAAPFFWNNGGLAGLFRLYKGTLSSYPYGAINAFNLFALAGGNWKPVEQSWLFLSFQTWGTIFIVLAVAVVVVFSLGRGWNGEEEPAGRTKLGDRPKSGLGDRPKPGVQAKHGAQTKHADRTKRADQSKHADQSMLTGRTKGKLKGHSRIRDTRAGGGAVFLLALILLVCIFLFGPKMHERYLFPGLLFCLLGFIQHKDRRLLVLFFGFSAAQYVNVDYVLKAFTILNSAPPIDGVAIVCSIAYMSLLVYLLYVAFDILFRGNVKPVLLRTEADKAAAQDLVLSDLDGAGAAGRSVSMRRKDWIWMGAITLLYAAVALFHLGDFKSPSTYWETSASGESFYVDLGSAKSLERINLFAGPGRGIVKMEFSNTPDNWDHETELDLYGKVFKWNTAQTLIEARYVKFTADSPETIVHEIGIYERGSKVPLSVAAIHTENLPSGDKGSPNLLFDEPGTDAYAPSYMNSSYFDEIYHARTAYEYLQGMPVYENTHPPFGKILISLGIKLFGLSPFGWRIVGTAVGIGMLPLIYRMALTLFKKSRYAIASTLLFAFDFMHFSQTRMSTIDVYAVFFMMLMYYFMYRYVSMNFYAVGLRKTLIPLGLSGLFFGIGTASKWNVAYGGAGLALMLGLSLYDRYRESKTAKVWLAESGAGTGTGPETRAGAGTGIGSETRGGAGTGIEAGTGSGSGNGTAGSTYAAERTGRDGNNKTHGHPHHDHNHDHNHNPNAVPHLGLKVRERAIAVYVNASRYFWRNTLLTLASCLIFFILIPAVIYSLSFIPVLNVEPGGYTFHNLIEAQVHMYDYHSELTATHPYSSQWWQWPFMKRPLWLYNGTDLAEGMKSTIVTMGNPLIWWTGLFTMLGTVWLSFKRRDKFMFMVWIAYFSVYIPWTLVPRYTFIYHYFTMVPFSILSTVYVLKLGEESDKRFRKVTVLFIIAAAVLFILFYPALSGLTVSKNYIDYLLRWFPTWDF